MARAVETFIRPGSNPYETHPHFRKKMRELQKGDAFRILALATDKGGCGWYRVRQLLREIDKQGLASTYVIESNNTEEELQLAIDNAHVLLVRRGNEEFLKVIRGQYPDKHAVVFDHDDNTFIVQPSNEHYVDFGIEDVYADTKEGQKPLWLSGITPGFDKFRNRHKMVDLEYGLESADLTTAPTARLAGLWSQYSGNSEVIPNCIDFQYYPDVEVRDRLKGDELRIGWQGGISHMGDFQEVGPEIAKALKKHKNTVYYSVGSFYEVFFKGVLDRVRVYPWIDFQAHGYRMKMFDLDIAVIPLQDLEFNTFKSEIKFSEFAALRVPCLVKRMTPYKEVVKEGETGLMYETQEEFGEQLERLIKDEKLRKKLSDNAYDWVRDERDLADWAPKVVDIYKEVYDGVVGRKDMKSDIINKE